MGQPQPPRTHGISGQTDVTARPSPGLIAERVYLGAGYPLPFAVLPWGGRTAPARGSGDLAVSMGPDPALKQRKHLETASIFPPAAPRPAPRAQLQPQTMQARGQAVSRGSQVKYTKFCLFFFFFHISGSTVPAAGRALGPRLCHLGHPRSLPPCSVRQPLQALGDYHPVTGSLTACQAEKTA